jgi:hypothetical protein
VTVATGIDRNTKPLITQPYILVSQSLCQGEADMAENEAKTVVKINTLSFISSCLFVLPPHYDSPFVLRTHLSVFISLFVRKQSDSFRRD